METWHHRFPVTLAGLLLACLLSGKSNAAESTSLADLGLEPEIERDEIQLSGIDTENFEVGVYGGLLSIEDFETNPLALASLTYHVTEDFFFEARYGTSTLGESSFDRLSGAASLLPPGSDEVTLYDLALGVNVLPGEAFVLDRWAIDSSFQLLGGVGVFRFAGEDHLTLSAGFGYRLLANDFLAMTLQVRDHLMDTEITGIEKTTHNIEVTAGISFFF